MYFEHNWHKRGVLRLWRYWIRNKMYSKREKVWWHQWLFWWVGWRYQYLWWVLDLIAHYHQTYFIGCIFLLINVVWMNGLIRRLIRLSFWPVSLWRWKMCWPKCNMQWILRLHRCCRRKRLQWVTTSSQIKPNHEDTCTVWSRTRIKY